MERYKITKTLGDGTYGSVVKATNIQSKEEVAIKKMKKKFQLNLLTLWPLKCLNKKD